MSCNCNRKTLLKTLTWRIIASSTTFTIAYLIQGKVEDAGLTTLLDSTIKTIFYYLHEKIYTKKNNNENDENNDEKNDDEKKIVNNNEV